MRSSVVVSCVALVVLGSAACGDSEADASIDVVVTSPAPGIDPRLDHVRVTAQWVSGDSARSFERAAVTDDDGSLAATVFRVRPENTSHAGREVYRFRAEGIADGAVVVTRQARLVFLSGRRLVLPLRLVQSCVRVDCDDASTCDDGLCIDDSVDACALEGARTGDCSDIIPLTDARVPRDAALEDAPSIDGGDPLDATAPPNDVGPPNDGAPLLDAMPPPLDATMPPPTDAGPPVGDARTGRCTGQPAGTPCRDARDACDVAELCDGASAECPPDEVASAGATCPGGVCDGLGSCGPCTEGAPCATGHDCESGTVSCSTGTFRCVGSPLAAGTLCRPVAGACDLEDRCDGASPDCPTDRVALSSVTCRAAVPGGCDVAERCSGTDAACPADVVRSAGTSCRASRGLCDASETCDGVSPNCPLDDRRAGMPCRPAAGDCDAEEVCDGIATSCPADLLLDDATVCRESFGPCDVEERCDGVDVDCADDAFLPATEVCRNAVATELCDAPEHCPGDDVFCPPNEPLSMGSVCRASTDYCDPAEVCNGVLFTCPPNAFRTNGSPCPTSCDTCICRDGVSVEDGCAG